MKCAILEHKIITRLIWFLFMCALPLIFAFFLLSFFLLMTCIALNLAALKKHQGHESAQNFQSMLSAWKRYSVLLWHSAGMLLCVHRDFRPCRATLLTWYEIYRRYSLQRKLCFLHQIYTYSNRQLITTFEGLVCFSIFQSYTYKSSCCLLYTYKTNIVLHSNIKRKK